MAFANRLNQVLKHTLNCGKFETCINSMKVISAKQGTIKCEMEVGTEHLNVNDQLHGGCTATLVDLVSTLALSTMPQHQFGATTDLNVSYMASAKLGDKLEITSEVLRCGNILGFATVNIVDQNNKLIAAGRHTKYMKAPSKRETS